MANYVLVHGGDKGDASIWENVGKLLASRDNMVISPSMKPLEEGAGLQDNINQICTVITDHNLKDVILVGHSYGAMVITGVADKLPDKIACLIYVDSAFPKSGHSLYGLFSEYGMDYKKFNLAPLKACLEPLTFNAEKINKKSKIYIHCLQSEFLGVTQFIYKEIHAALKTNNWSCFILDTDHACMVTQPQEVAIILQGAQLMI